ncbi:MAG: hypothetical protein JKP98_21025 [Rhodobacteraceae bacterium]|nr:hypothetical protein [Paracoccaceae bacterium]
MTSTAAGSDAGSVYLINENDYAAADAADGTVDGVIDLVHVPDLARSYMLMAPRRGMRRGPRSATHSSARRGPTSAAAMPGRSIPIRPMI